MFSNFLTVFRFEIFYWLKSMMVWVFLAIMTALLMAVLLNEDPVMMDMFFGQSYRNSAYVIQRLYAFTAVFGCLMVTAFVNAAATRDFAYGTQQLIFTKPLDKFSYLMGRFTGSMVISLIPMLGASLAVILGELFHTHGKWGPSQWHAHFWGILVVLLPNTFFLASIVFSIAVWTRSTLASFIGILGLLVAMSISGALMRNLEDKMLAAMLDPFGDDALALLTQYWTVKDKNTLTVPLLDNDGFNVLFWNRLLWISVGAVFFAAGYFRFSFTLEEGLIGRLWRMTKEAVAQSLIGSYHTSELPVVRRSFSTGTRLRQLWNLTVSEFLQTWRSPIFICIMIGILFVTMTNFSVRTSGMFGVSTLPVTFSMVEAVRDSTLQFQLAVITFYAGVFVWKERDAKLDEIQDALPIPTGLTFLSKLLAMYAVIISIIVVGILCAIGFQLTQGYYSPDIGLYVTELLGWDMVQVTCLIVLAFLCHVISPNKYVGYFLYIGVFVANGLVWALLDFRTNMVRFGNLPSYTYSDMFGREPYLPILRWFGSYWMLFAALLAFGCVLLWPRGKERGLARLRDAAPRWKGVVQWGSLATLCLWLLTAGWIFQNTMIANKLESTAVEEIRQAAYEKEYRPLMKSAQPRVVKVRYDIDLFPSERRLDLRANQWIENHSDQPIDTIYVTLDPDNQQTVEIEGAVIESKDEEKGLWTYKVDPPMTPGEQRKMEIRFEFQPQGFTNSLQFRGVLQNGSFFDSSILPQLGYQSGREMKDPKDREKYGLPGLSFVQLDPDNLEARQNTYISNNSDWVEVETVISTSGDQIAVAPGSLQRHWKENDRNYYHYQLDHPSLNFYSFVSARYKVKTQQLNDIELEVYYHPDHDWNVDLMLRSMRSALEYYTENFGPYRHRQARIVEFPRIATFAQAFPGTMPYSEGIGFIADLKDTDNDIDMVRYVVAHEIAHQWWAHQVIGANMQGATVLSETLAQYSALMVMEKEYGEDMMRKFLQYEMDNYLRARGRSQRAEQPLKKVEMDQGYIHYNKGSLAMYLLKETIGEDKVNQALRTLVDKFGYQGPPYPTSEDLVSALREVTPAEHQTLIDDLFEHITLFDNRTTDATWKKRDDGQYDVQMTVQFRKLRSDGTGKETEVPLNDWIEIGAFAKAPGAGRFGETLHRERVLVTQSPQTFQFVVSKWPDKVGVDPISLLIDRNKADNMIQPKEAK